MGHPCRDSPAAQSLRNGRVSTRPDVGKKNVPDLVGLFRHRDPDIFLRGVDVIEQAEIDRRRVFGENREVDSVPEPGRSERIGITEPNFYRRHKMSVFYPLRARGWQRPEKSLPGT